MSTITAHYQKAGEELDNYLTKSEDFRNDKSERAFIYWYLKARFGQSKNSNKSIVVDGNRDGGIDAFFDDDQIVHIFQMKYETKPRSSALKSDEVGDFERVHDVFQNEESFEKFIATVREDCAKHYRRIFSELKSRKKSARFILVTTKRYPGSLISSKIEVEEASKVFSLWNLYSEGFTPPVESIPLRLDSAWHHESANGKFTTYVGLADVQEFRKLMDQDANDRLFAQNVRTDLKTLTNKEIRETYEREPDKFWLGNNGVYIICKDVTIQGSIYTLVFPSVINGSQTLHSINKSQARHSCKILVRILKMDTEGDSRLLGEVVRRTNAQNPMKPINLVAHDLAQLSVARYLDRFGIFYERREREWANGKKLLLYKYTVVNVKELGQWLSTLHESIGLGRARSRVAELFQEKYYHRIFESFDRDFKSPEYINLPVMVWAGLLVKNLIRRLPRKNKVLVKIPQLLFVKFFFEAIKDEYELRNRTKDALGKQLMIKGAMPTSIERLVVEIAKDFEHIQKARQKKDENLDYSNYFKRDKESSDAYEKACTEARKKKLRKLLINSLKDSDSR